MTAPIHADDLFVCGSCGKPVRNDGGATFEPIGTAAGIPIPHTCRTPIRTDTAGSLIEDDIVTLLVGALAIRVTEIAGDHADSGDALDAMLDAVRGAYRHGDLSTLRVNSHHGDHGVVEGVTVEAVSE